MVASLVASVKSPLVKLRAMAHKVNFYHLIDFVHLCYLHIIKFFIPLSSFSFNNGNLLHDYEKNYLECKKVKTLNSC